MYSKVETIYYQYKNKSFGEAGYSTYYVLKNIDPVVFSCYFATFEYKYAFEVYVNTLQDFSKLLYNTCHNLGIIYDYAEEAIYRWIDVETEYQYREFWIRMGSITGGVFHAFL